MKKITLMLLSLMIVMYSCQKETNKLTNQSLLKQDEQVLSKLRLNNQTTESIIKLSLDEEDALVRTVQNKIGNALTKTLINNKPFVNAIITDAQNSPLKESNLNRIFKNNSQFELEMNMHISEIDKNETFSSLEQKLKYKGNKYEPVIVIPNLDKADLKLKPIVSGGLDVEEITVDDILAYFIKEDGEITEVLLNENEAIELTKPILIFGLGENDEKFIGKNILLDKNQYYDYNQEVKDSTYYLNMQNSKSTNAKSSKNFLNMHTSIKSQSYFYEGSGKNEYTEIAFPFLNLNYFGYEPYDNGTSRINTLGRYAKSECNGAQKNYWSQLVYFSTNINAPNTPNDVFTYRTYERDWFNGNKSLATSYYNGKLCEPFGKRRYAGEWYINYNWVWNQSNSPLTVWQYKYFQSYKSGIAFTRSN